MLVPSPRFTALATAALCALACGRGEGSRGTAGARDAALADSARAIHVVTVTASDYAFDAPGQVPAGLTTFRLVNNGPSLHHVQLVRLNEGKTVADLLAALKTNGPPPTWIAMAGGPNPPEVGSTAQATVMLEPGTYAIVCFIPDTTGAPHLVRGMARTLTVTGPARPAVAEPAADVVVKLVDYDFQLSKPLVVGPNALRVENAGAQPHEVVIVRLAAGKTPQDAAKWGMHPVGPPPGTVHGGVSGIMPGAHAFATVDLPVGEYALICFVPDGKDGKPHFAHGMAKKIVVS